jgi:glyoxylase-like metal-dependent hydrolase (beta-lactamase superfamily II)
VERLTPNVFVETQRQGANHGYVTTAAGIVLIDTPFMPSDALQLRREIEAAGRLRYVINTEPHWDHWSSNRFFDAPAVAHEGVRERMLAMDLEKHRARIDRFGPGKLDLFDAYPATLPEITFTTAMTLRVGGHTFRLINMPGHTPYQAAIVVEEEGVVFTSDNVFSGVHTWLQEADPDAWLRALDDLRALDVDVLVPGHGAVCDRTAIATQEAVIREWVAYVQAGIDRGLTRDAAMDELTAMIDRFPMDVGQDDMAPRVMRDNVGNLFDYLTRSGIHTRA